jgi:hypothetical protein
MSKWSDECLFHASTPPQLVDTIVGFTRWAVDRWYRPSVKVMDPDGDSVSAKFIWGDSIASNWSPFVASGGTVTDSVKWQTTGRRAVRVVLKDKGSMVNQNAGGKSVNVSPMAILWHTYDQDQSYDASPALATIDGEPVVYCISCDGVECYDLAGQLRWRMSAFDPIGEYAPSLSPDGSRLYLTDYVEGVWCLGTRDGQKKWSFSLDFAAGTPAIGPAGEVYVITWGNFPSLYRFRDCGDSVTFLWKVQLGSSLQATGAVISQTGVIYVVTEQLPGGYAALVAIDSTGATLWRDTTHLGNAYDESAPVIDSHGRILVGDPDRYLYCFNPDGTLAWQTSTGDFYGGSLAVGFDDQVLLLNGDAARLWCYDSAGREQWSADLLEYQGRNTPCIAQDSTIVTYDPDVGYVYGIDAEGQTLWQFSIWDSMDYKKHPARRDEGDMCPSAVIGPNGNLYLASEDGLVCIACGDIRPANTAWPTYNHDNARSGWAGRH